MNEYHVSFRKAFSNAGTEIVARVPEDNPRLVQLVETIRSRIVAESARTDLDAIPGGPFLEVELLMESQGFSGVYFTTPYLPGTFVATLQKILADLGIGSAF